MMVQAGHVAHKAEKRNACRVLLEKPDVKRPHGRPGDRWQDDINGP